jgi:GTP pyrophosphokinase
MHLQANFAFRSIKAKWETIEENQFLTGIKFKGTDDLGLLNKILLVISKQEKVNIKSVYFDAEFGIFEGTIMLYVNNTNQLDKLKEKLLVIDGIHEIKRVDTNVYSEED